MDAELKAKWIEALRSGKYEQGNRFLQSVDHKFCCLGVLCEVAGMVGSITTGTVKPCYTYDGHSGLLPEELSRKLDESIEMYLIHMNDQLRNNFSEIADYIEEHV